MFPLIWESPKQKNLPRALLDHGPKLDGYFALRSVEHYLILDPDRRVMIWHKRGQAGAIETRILRDGLIRLDPPGLEAEVEGFFPAN